MTDNTIQFKIGHDKDIRVRLLINGVYGALKEKGYNPLNQLVGYIMSGDPTYITSYRNARSLICKVDRDDILHAVLKYYINNET